MKNLLMIGAVSFVFTGCASNGGGHVVGNSAIPANTAKKMAMNDKTCACGHKHEAGAEHATCSECGDKKGKDSACTKCGTSECTCNH